MRKHLIAGVSVLALGATGAMAQESSKSIQEGIDGSVYINQTNTTGTADARIKQGFFSTGDGGAIYQSGAGTVDARINQNVDGTFGTGIGQDSIAGIVQDDDSGSSLARINQSGTEQVAGIQQEGSDNESRINQDGFQDQALILQGADGSGFSSLNNPTPNSPDFNAALLAARTNAAAVAPQANPYGLPLTPGLPSAEATNSKATIVQTGDQGATSPGAFNVAGINQSGGDQEARSRQFGEGNQSLISQEDSDNDADVTQELNDNVAAVVQIGTTNTAKVDQFGDGNTAGVLQEDIGSNDDVKIKQFGDEETAMVYQNNDGIQSSADVDQSGFQNHTLILQ